MKYLILLFIGCLLLFSSPLFLFGSELQKPSNHRFYAQPIFIFNKEVTFFGGGIGYRFHNAKQGCDISLNFHQVQICSSKGYWPFLKASYLFYPQSKGLYFGIGANLSIFAGPLSTLGYELHNKELLIFLQLDVTYPSAIKEPVGSVSLGIGF